MKKRRIDHGPAESMTTEAGSESELTATFCGPHQVEEDVQRELLGHEALRFSSLVVRRVPNGVCLEGVLEADDVDAAASSVCGLARRVAGVQKVLNHLLVRQSENRLAPKG